MIRRTSDKLTWVIVAYLLIEQFLFRYNCDIKDLLQFVPTVSQAIGK
jgi:hypothetical protein